MEQDDLATQRILGWVTGILLLASIAVAILWWLSRPDAPDSFYSGTVAGNPGPLLRSEKFTRAVPEGERAWRILYVTTRGDGSRTLASAIVMAPAHPSGPRPVLAWAHGETGIAPGCAPSMLANPFAGIPAMKQIVASGWVFVATDYAGLGTGGPNGFLSGEDEARSELDAVRAARHLKAVSLENNVVVWGHSQGGHAALWTGIIGPRYAPDVHLTGIVPIAPETDLVALVARDRGLVPKILMSYIVSAYSQIYPDVKPANYVSDRASRYEADMAGRCLTGWRSDLSLGEAALSGVTIFAADPARGPLGKRLMQNTPTGRVPEPLLIAQGDRDDIVLPDVQQHFVQQRCTAGQSLEYHVYQDQDHSSIVGQGSPLGPDLVRWTEDRFAGKPQANGCKFSGSRRVAGLLDLSH
jgi:acetyl esterase/lipase